MKKKLSIVQKEFFLGKESSSEVDYEEVFFDNVLMDLPESISNLYIEKNKDFIKQVCNAMFEKELFVGDASFILEKVITGLFKYKPITSKIEYSDE